MARRWTARQVAEAVGAAYAADCEWGGRWLRINSQTRAEFDVRVFAGMITTGLDQLIELNYVSAHEKGVCRGRCPFDCGMIAIACVMASRHDVASRAVDRSLHRRR